MRQTKRMFRKGKRFFQRIGHVGDLNWHAILTTVGCLLFGLVVVLMHKKIYEMMMRTESYQIRVEKLQAATFPDWADGRVKEDIRNNLSGAPISMYDPDLLKKVKHRYESSEWVRRIRKIKRNGLRGVRVTFELRRPVAVLLDRDGQKYLVDRKGVRVPGVYREVPDRFGTVYPIHGYVSGAPEPGEKWQSRRVRAAASVAGILQKTNVDRFLEIRRIELSGSAEEWERGEGQIILRTGTNKPVVWGGANEQRIPWEPTPRAKLKNLKTVLKGAPDLEGLDQVKLQFSDPIVSMK